MSGPGSERHPNTSSEEHMKRARATVDRIVDAGKPAEPKKSMFSKGLPPRKAFQQEQAEYIFQRYVEVALEVVDDGRWQDANEEARLAVTALLARQYEIESEK